MFVEIDITAFERLKSMKFSSGAFDQKFQSYFTLTHQIYNAFLVVGKYDRYISESLKKTLLEDEKKLIGILKQILSGQIKSPDARLKTELFTKDYLERLLEMAKEYSYVESIFQFSNSEHEKAMSVSEKLVSDKSKNHGQELRKKTLEIARLNWVITEKEKQSEVNLKDKDILKNKVSDLELELQKRELNKLAQAFHEQAEKNSGMLNLIWIYFGFILLSLPCIFSIYIVLSELINHQIFNSINKEAINPYIFIPFIALTLILWYLQYFQLKNFYIKKDLAINFSNRKAVAQSFKWLLELTNEEWDKLGDKSELISTFISRASQIMYSEIDTTPIKKHEENIPTTKVLDILQELIGKIKIGS